MVQQKVLTKALVYNQQSYFLSFFEEQSPQTALTHRNYILFMTSLNLESRLMKLSHVHVEGGIT